MRHNQLLATPSFALLILFLSLAYPHTAHAQAASPLSAASDSVVKPRKPSWLTRFIRSFSDLDTNYVQPNYYNYITMLQNTNTFDHYTMRVIGKDKNEQYQVSLHPTPSFRLGPYVGWRWLFVGYTFDVGHVARATQKRDFTFSLYTASIGADFIWKRNSRAFTLYPERRMAGAFDSPNASYRFDGMSVSNTTINAYYIFNSRKFSYPAAFNQSTAQIKSAGSWMIGARYARQKIDIDNTKLPALTHKEEADRVTEVLKYSTISHKKYSLNIGYGYNWVFARHWLLAGSLMPSIGVKEVFTTTSKTGEASHKITPNVDATIRIGLVWNNSKFFVGSSLISHVYNHHNADYRLRNSFTTLNVYVGFNFVTRKEYRKR